MYGIRFDRDPSLSQYRQLVEQLRDAVVSGGIDGGSRLASTRALASRLGISRGIVLEAIDQLKMEGYLYTVHGSGTYVREGLVRTRAMKDTAVDNTGEHERPGPLLSFFPGMPDVSLFPRRQWLSCYRNAVEYASAEDIGYISPCGRWDLRASIARYVREAKGIRTSPSQVVITAGSSQAFAILSQVFRQGRIVMEDPHAPFVCRIFEEHGCSISCVPVDEEGMLPGDIPDTAHDFVYLTPAHQFPVGGTLGPERRGAILDKAAGIGAWIIEDDFDSEFRYVGHPVPALQVLDPERVVYVGTFSKTVSPALRIGYMIVPSELLIRVKTLKQRWDYLNEGFQQKAMSLFIERGHLDRHIARVHRVYKRKSRFLCELVQQRLFPRWKVTGATTGMHLVLRFTTPDGKAKDVLPVVTELKELGMEVEAVPHYCRKNKSFGDTLIVGFGNRESRELEALVEYLEIIAR